MTDCEICYFISFFEYYTLFKIFNQNQSHCWHLLDSVGEDDEAHEDPYCSVQVPHLGLMFEHFSTDEDGEPHDASNQRVKSWKPETQFSTESLIQLLTHFEMWNMVVAAPCMYPPWILFCFFKLFSPPNLCQCITLKLPWFFCASLRNRLFSMATIQHQKCLVGPSSTFKTQLLPHSVPSN